MQCTRCYSNMQLVKRETHQASLLEWHQCPLCRRMEFLSQPVHYDLEAFHSPLDQDLATPLMR
jgi:hypothetical protein